MAFASGVAIGARKDSSLAFKSGDIRLFSWGFAGQGEPRTSPGCTQNEPKRTQHEPRMNPGIRLLVVCFFGHRPGQGGKVAAAKERRGRKSPAIPPHASFFCVLCALSRLHSPVLSSYILRHTTFPPRACQVGSQMESFASDVFRDAWAPLRFSAAGAHRRPSPQVVCIQHFTVDERKAIGGPSVGGGWGASRGAAWPAACHLWYVNSSIH